MKKQFAIFYLINDDYAIANFSSSTAALSIETTWTNLIKTSWLIYKLQLLDISQIAKTFLFESETDTFKNHILNCEFGFDKEAKKVSTRLFKIMAQTDLVYINVSNVDLADSIKHDSALKPKPRSNKITI